MKYVGSKNRISKFILPFILPYLQNRTYIEPFVGGANLIDKIPKQIPRIGNDKHPYLIALLREIQNGWVPPDTVSETFYYEIKNNKEKFNPALVGFVGFCCSFAGKWFGGYARGKDTLGFPRNYAKEQQTNLVKQTSHLQGIIFKCGDYSEIVINSPSVIYCDPPYQNTVKYSNEINHEEFFNWCREKYNEGHTIFLSEYQAPEDFKLLFSKQVNNTLNLNTSEKQGFEKLFILQP